MPQFSAILRSVGIEKFSEILAASARKSREVYYHRHDVRAKKASGLPKAGAKNEYRNAQLLAALQHRDDEQLAEEALRTWFLGKRALLGAALNHLGIAHKDGLTESDDVSRIEKLTQAEVTALGEKLCQLAPRADVVLYLKFMGAQNVDEALPGGV